MNTPASQTSKSLFKCIRCDSKPADTKSHVVSGSLRKKLYGEPRRGGIAFAFEYAERNDLPLQDFPKPVLMCTDCDNGFGGTVEKNIPRILLPRDVGDWEQWTQLGLKPVQLGHHHFFDYSGSAHLHQIERFAALTAWRAMHAMARDGSAVMAEYVASPAGVSLDQAMLAYIESKPPLPGVTLPKPSLLCLSGKQIAEVTGEDDRLPISWAALGVPADVTLAVFFGFWLVTWRLPGSTSRLDQLLTHWFERMREQHRELVSTRRR